VGVAGEEVAVAARGAAEDDALELHVADARDQFHVLQQVGEEVRDQRVGVGRCSIQCLDQVAAAQRGGSALDHPAQFLVVGADDDGAVLHRGGMAAHRDLGLGPGFAGLVRRGGVEPLEQPGGGGQQAQALFLEGLELGIGERRGAEYLDGEHGVYHGLVAGVVDLQHDVRAEGLDRIEQNGARVQAKVAFAGIEHDVVLLEVHRAARQDAGVRGDGEGGDVVADLDLVDEGTAGVTADDMLEIEALQPGGEGVVDRVGREEDPALRIEGNGVGQLPGVGLEAGPDLSAGQLGGGRGVKETADGSSGAEQFLPVGGVGEAGVVEEGLGLQREAVAIHDWGAVEEHLDADAGEGAALGELEGREMNLQEFEFGRVAGPERQGQGNGVIVLVFQIEDLAVLARPKLVGDHSIRVKGGCRGS